MAPGDTAHLATSGGGGWGDPMRRDIARVLRDVADEFITADQADQLYGVSLRHENGDWTVDQAATDRRRAMLSKKNHGKEIRT